MIKKKYFAYLQLLPLIALGRSQAMLITNALIND